MSSGSRRIMTSAIRVNVSKDIAITLYFNDTEFSIAAWRRWMEELAGNDPNVITAQGIGNDSESNLCKVVQLIFWRKEMLKRLLAVVAMSVFTASAFAVDLSQVAKSFPLKDGSTVYVYKDGKMGMEDKMGRATYMNPNHVMETKDGKKIIMIGNEIWRVDEMLHGEHKLGG